MCDRASHPMYAAPQHVSCQCTGYPHSTHTAANFVRSELAGFLRTRVRAQYATDITHVTRA